MMKRGKKEFWNKRTTVDNYRSFVVVVFHYRTLILLDHICNNYVSTV